MTSADEYRDWDAAYVMGMLCPEERREYERHLADCHECSHAVAELAGLPGVLGSLSAGEASALLAPEASSAAPASSPAAPPSGTVQHLARAVGRRRRTVRRRMAAAVVGTGVLLAGAGVLTGLAIGQFAPLPGTAPAATAEAGSPAVDATPAGLRLAMGQVEPGYIDAELRVSPKEWGTRFDWDCSYSEKLQATLDGPVPYDLVVTDRSGIETTVASWTAEKGAAAGNLSASTSIPAAQIASVDIRITGSDQPIVRTEL
ncbi:anti-sigma factor [Herbiconiux sp. VKM Ac-2851]|uniref:anti-sigma factor family protein n=1 Tax=Herbiconiux sp. VKM Ac-2851 TaxID=2739025 RepID=UPI001563B357|nr:zf-HC2 domain-containing protein [Herbiconiux sp. VKM Ac-2851]NQX34410.1 zf-HC2 domain-containing protein [Herbiconiux sp. VKM Ac-2851]